MSISDKTKNDMSNKRIKILFHIPCLRIGGAEGQLTYLTKGLLVKNFDVHISTFYKGGKFWDDLSAIYDCCLVCLNRKNRWDFSVILKLARYVEANDIDIIQGWLSPCNSFSAIVGILTGRPVIMSIRQTNVDYPLGGRIYRNTDKFLAKTVAKKIVCNSYAGCDYYVKIGFPKEKMLVIPNAIEFPKQQNFRKPLSRGYPCKIGMIARLDPMKDHLTMFKALRLIIDKGKQVELHIYGDGPDVYRQMLRERCVEIGIKDYVYWHGWTDNVWDTLSEIDILVSSSYGEGMSNTILEAMVSGRIIIATDVGDSKKMLLEGSNKCGFIVPAKSPESIAHVIEMILDDPEDALQRAEQAKIVAEKCFRIESMVEQYVSLYNELISEKDES